LEGFRASYQNGSEQLQTAHTGYVSVDEYERPLWRIAKIQKLLDQEVAVRRASEERLTLMYRELVVLKTELSGDPAMDVPTLDPSITDPEAGQQAAAMVNGEPVSDRAVEILRRQRFQVILSVPALRVWARGGAEADGKWAGSDIQGLRHNRSLLFLHMLMHPRTVVGTHNVDEICQSDPILPNALARTMKVFRALLYQYEPDGPYIINRRVLVSAGIRRGYMANGYTLSPAHNYLVILKEF
jgi:hypothetical protein